MYKGSYETDARVAPECTSTLSATSSLPQGETFSKMTSSFHGGKRARTAKKSRKVTKAKKTKNAKKAKRSTRKMYGGSASYPTSFSELLPTDLHGAADISKLDTAFAQLPEFAGKYGMSGGGRRKMYGGVAPVNAPSMILGPGEEPSAFLNPQWYTENQVIPSFKGPDNAYVQKAGRRKKTKKTKKATRRH